MKPFLGTVLEGFIVFVILAVILSFPGWAAAAVWGWDWLWRGAGLFWLGACGVGLILLLFWGLAPHRSDIPWDTENQKRRH